MPLSFKYFLNSEDLNSVKIPLKEGFNPIICHLFDDYYDERSTKYLWNQHFSGDYDVNNGVPQGDLLSPIISVIYMSAMLRQLFPFDENWDTQCLSYINDFVLLTASPSLATNVDRLEDDFIRLSRAFNVLGIMVETSKTELMHFTAKWPQNGPGRQPLHFECIHSLLPVIKLHPMRHNMPMYIITPSKEWCYLGFYFDQFLSFSSHIRRYASKALVTANNLKILGHSLGGVDPVLRRHVYQAVVWSVLSYGLPLWYRMDGKGCKAHLKLLNKNKMLCYDGLAALFTPCPFHDWSISLEYHRFGRKQTICYTMLFSAPLAYPQVISSIAWQLHLSCRLQNHRYGQRPPQDNIWLLKEAVQQHPPLALLDPLTQIGNRLLDCTTWVRITIPVAPSQVSKVFEQWPGGWMQQCHTNAADKIIVGSDGSYKIKGQGASAFVVKHNGVIIHSASQLVLAHSSYDAEMHMANQASNISCTT